MSKPKIGLKPFEYPADAYPDRHPKGSFWATDIAWDILDRLPVGTLDNVQRAYLAGLIAGELSKERDGSDLIRTLERIARYPFDDPQSNDAHIIRELALSSLPKP